MSSRNLWQYTALAGALILALVVMVVAVPTHSQTSFAQDEGTAIAYGEVVEGDLDANGSATYYFDAEAGDMAQIDVMAFNFVPNVELQNANQTSVLADEVNPLQSQVVRVTQANLTSGRYYIKVSGDAGTLGHFAVALQKVVHVLPDGNQLESGQSATSDVFLAVVYNFSGDPDNVLVLSVRSLTDGYRPKVTVLTDAGETVAAISPRFLGTTFIIEPGDQDYRVVIEKGGFPGMPTVEVSLSGGGVGLTEAPTEGCSISTDSRINVRAGGSLDHAVVAVLGENRFLPVIGMNPANGTWYQVQLPDGRTGWVSSEVVTLVGSCENLPQTEYPPVQPVPTAEPTMEGTVEPTVEGTVEPTIEPTTEGTIEPTIEVTIEPTIEITKEPTLDVTPSTPMAN
jgi:hypothetical protein